MVCEPCGARTERQRRVNGHSVIHRPGLASNVRILTRTSEGLISEGARKAVPLGQSKGLGRARTPDSLETLSQGLRCKCV